MGQALRAQEVRFLYRSAAHQARRHFSSHARCTARAEAGLDHDSASAHPCVLAVHFLLPSLQRETLIEIARANGLKGPLTRMRKQELIEVHQRAGHRGRCSRGAWPARRLWMPGVFCSFFA